MSQEQRSTISGTIWDVYTPASQEFKENRMPRVGQVVCYEDGRRFVFSSTQVDVAAGLTVGKPTPTATTVGSTSAASKGQRTVKVDGTDVAANWWKGGHIAFEALAGTYKIKSNKGVVGAGLVEIELYDPLVTDVPGSTVANIVTTLSGDVIVGTSTNHIVGVTNQNILAAAAGTVMYFWAQTSGNARVPATVTPGLSLMQASAGAVAAGDGTRESLGTAIAVVGSSTMVDLRIDQVL